MKKRMAFYMRFDHLPWPDTIREKFKGSMSKFGVVYLEQDSQTEHAFLGLASNLELNLERKTYLKCTGKDLLDQPFHYLSPPTSDITFEEAIDYVTACKDCGNGPSRIGGTQRRKLKVASTELKQGCDIISFYHHGRPNICVISRKLKDLMVETELTGCRFIPCLVKGVEYSREEEDLGFKSKRLERDAKYFQLIITEKVKNPPYGGEVRDFLKPCPSCGTHWGFLLSITPYFRRDDLNDIDFQIFDQYESSNIGRFSIPGESDIISARVLKLLIEKKVKLSRWTTDPPNQYGVVEIIDD